MDCIELDVEVIVADEAFDIHPPHPAAVCDAHVDAAWEHRVQRGEPIHEAHVVEYYEHDDGDIPL